MLKFVHGLFTVPSMLDCEPVLFQPPASLARSFPAYFAATRGPRRIPVRVTGCSHPFGDAEHESAVILTLEPLGGGSPFKTGPIVDERVTAVALAALQDGSYLEALGAFETSSGRKRTEHVFDLK